MSVGLGGLRSFIYIIPWGMGSVSVRLGGLSSFIYIIPWGEGFCVC